MPQGVDNQSGIGTHWGAADAHEKPRSLSLTAGGCEAAAAVVVVTVSVDTVPSTDVVVVVVVVVGMAWESACVSARELAPSVSS